MDSLTLNNINKFTNLDDPNILNFELRLLKNNNDYLDYINYLETKTATTPEQYICLYLRLIIVYNNEINVATNLWKYLIKYYGISNENALEVLSTSFVETIIQNLSNASIISLLKFFTTSNQITLKYLTFDVITKLFEHKRTADIFEAVDLQKISSSDKNYGSLYNFTEYLPYICKVGSLPFTPSQKFKSKQLFKYLTMLHVSEKSIDMSLVKKAAAVENLKSLNDFDSLYLFFDKLEKDPVQFVYYAILKLLTDEDFKNTGKPVVNKINQLFSTAFKKTNSSDVYALKWLYSLLSKENIQIDTLIKDLKETIQSSNKIDHFEAHYDILVQLLKCVCIEDSNKADSVNILEVVINEFESKRVMCLLKENITNFQYWRHFLNTSNFNQQSLEYFLTTVELNSNKTYFLKNVLPGELGNIWSAYAEFFVEDIDSYRNIIKCSLSMNYFYYQDVELILINWLSKEQLNDNRTHFDKLIEKLINYSDIVHSNDNITKTLKSSKKIWNYLLNECEEHKKITVYKKMASYDLITTSTVEYVTNYALNQLNDTDAFFELWLQAFTDFFIQMDKELQVMFETFTVQSLKLKLFEKAAFTAQILKSIINKVELSKKEFWIKKYVDLLTENKMESSQKIYLLNKTIMHHIPLLKSPYLLDKWVEMISNINVNSLSTGLVSKIRFDDLCEILKTYNGLEIISSKLPTTLIAFESVFSNNTERIRELYIYFAQLLPPSFNNDMENLWKSWEEFEIKSGKLKDLIRWRKDITATFQQLGYQKQPTINQTNKVTSNQIEFVKERTIKTEDNEGNLLKAKEEN